MERHTRKLADLHPFSLLVFTAKDQTTGRKFVNPFWVYFIPVPVSFPDFSRAAVELPHLGPGFGTRFEYSRPQTQSHSSTHMCRRNLRHEDDSGELRFLVEFSRGSLC